MPKDHADLEQMIAAAARFLPPQGPIDAFVAQNPLQGYEDLPFEEAVVRAARLYNAQPFLPESDYRTHLATGRIRVAQLQRHGVQLESDTAVRWTLTESDAIERLRDDLEPLVRGHLLETDAAEAG